MSTAGGPNHADVVEEFLGLCNWAYESWMTRRTLFDDNPAFPKSMKQSGRARAISRLSSVMQEHALLQVAKLHDPEKIGKHTNLSLEFVMRNCGLSPAAQANLAKIHAKIEPFGAQLRDARSKALAHHDVSAVLAGNPLGGFPADEDLTYFRDLEQFLDVLRTDVCGRQFRFRWGVVEDAKELAPAITAEAGGVA